MSLSAALSNWAMAVSSGLAPGLAAALGTVTYVRPITVIGAPGLLFRGPSSVVPCRVRLLLFLRVGILFFLGIGLALA